MKKTSAKEILVPAVSLFIICVVVTAILAFTNTLTAPKIAALAKETQEKAKREVLTTATSFSDEKAAPAGAQFPEGTAYYEGTLEDGSLAGYVVLTSAKGYGGDIKVMVGLDTEGTVTGVNILSISETVGLGMNATKPEFLEQYKGRAGQIGVAKNNPKDNEIQALTGATITSKAMTTAVNTAISLYAEIGGEQNG